MNLVVEISMYPFTGDYKTLIKDFIARLNSYPDLKCSTSATSTIISGDYDHVMQVLKEMLAWSHSEQGRAVFVTKFIPGMTAE